MSAFRPRSAAEIADAAIQLVRRHYAALLPLSALLSIPSVLLGLLTARAGPVGATAPDAGQLAAVFIPSIVAAVWWFVALGALVAVAAAAYLGEPLDPMEGVRRAFGRAGALIGANVVSSLLALGALVVVAAVAALVIGLLFAFVVPGGPAALASGSGGAVTVVTLLVMLVAMVWPMIIFARYVIVTPVIVAERVSTTAALKRARQLSQGFVWRSLGLLVIALVILFATMLTAFGLFGLVVSNEQATGALTNLALVPLYPAWACLVTVLYYDLRIRKEGYDIELMARAMGEGAPPAAALGTGAPAGAPVGGAGH